MIDEALVSLGFKHQFMDEAAVTKQNSKFELLCQFRTSARIHFVDSKDLISRRLLYLLFLLIVGIYKIIS